MRRSVILPLAVLAAAAAGWLWSEHAGKNSELTGSGPATEPEPPERAAPSADSGAGSSPLDFARNVSRRTAEELIELNSVDPEDADRIRSIRDESDRIIEAQRARYGSGGMESRGGGAIDIVGTMIHLEDCWLFLGDGSIGAYQLDGLPSGLMLVGQRLALRLRGRLPSDLPTCRYPVAEVLRYATVDGLPPPTPALEALKARVDTTLADLDIDASTSIRGSYVEIAGIGISDGIRLESALGGEFAQLDIWTGLSSSARSFVNVWPAVGGGSAAPAPVSEP